MSKYIVTIASSSPLTKEAAKANFEANVLSYAPVENLNMAIDHLNYMSKSFVLKSPAHLCVLEARYDDCPNATRYEIAYELLPADAEHSSFDWNNKKLMLFGTRVPKFYEKMSLGTLRKIFAACHKTHKHMHCVFVYPDNIWKERLGKGTHYEVVERSYVTYSDSCGFDPSSMGHCIIGSALDFTECAVRLDYMQYCPEYCYLIPEEDVNAYNKEAAAHDPWRNKGLKPTVDVWDFGHEVTEAVK